MTACGGDPYEEIRQFHRYGGRVYDCLKLSPAFSFRELLDDVALCKFHVMCTTRTFIFKKIKLLSAHILRKPQVERCSAKHYA